MRVMRDLCNDFALAPKRFSKIFIKRKKNIFDFDPVRVPILIVCNLQVGVKIGGKEETERQMKNM